MDKITEQNRGVLSAWRDAYGEIQLLVEDADLDPNTWTEVCEALADAIDAGGLLIEPGSETRVEWAYQVAGHAEPWGHTRYRYRAEERLSAYLEQMPAGQAHLVRRNIYTAPWRPVDASGDTP